MHFRLHEYMNRKLRLGIERMTALSTAMIIILSTVGQQTMASYIPDKDSIENGKTQVEQQKTNIPHVTMPAYKELELVPETTKQPASTPKPTMTPIPKEKEEQLIAAETTTSQEVIYSSQDEYFGEDLDSSEADKIVIDIPTVIPTQQPTPATPDGASQISSPAPTEVIEQPSADGSCEPSESQGTQTSGTPSSDSSPLPEVTVEPTTSPVITPEPTPTPTPVQTSTPVPTYNGPVLQCTDGNYSSLTQIKRYNGWGDEYKQYAYEVAKVYGVPYEMLLAIINNESGFNGAATHVNKNGTTDWGLMQINDVCISFVSARVPGVSTGADLLNEYKAIQAGAAILAYHYNRCGSIDEALLRYQVGEGNAKYYISNGTRPAVHTKVMGYYNSYVAAGI